jgi:glyoxylase-like metal-dependent hydrolase (beta-lactamase superfamily II)
MTNHHATITLGHSPRLVLPLLLALGCGDDTSETSTSETSTGSTTAAESLDTGATSIPSTTSDDGATTMPGSTATTETTTEGQDDALDRVLEYMGGAAALASLGAFEASAQGTRYVPGEGYMPGEPAMPANEFQHLTRYDLAGQRLRIAVDRTLVVFGLAVPQAYSEVVDGQLGAIDGSESLFGLPGGAMLSDRWASTLRQQQILHPHVLLREVASDPTLAQVLDPETIDGTLYDVIELSDPVAPLQLLADPTTGEPRMLITLENDPLYRDVELVASYDDWQPSDGAIPFPGHVTLARGGELLHDELRSQLALDPRLPADAFELPPDASPTYVAADAERGLRSHQFHQVFASIGIPADGIQSTVMPLEVAPGVWHLRGGTHHSLLVEQDGGLVLVEAPLYPERSEAIMEWIDATFPGQSITHVVVTHHHDDHGAGAREILAMGATLVVSTAAEEHWGEVLAAPSTIVPDALSESPVDVPIELVPEAMGTTLADATRPIEIYPVFNVHAVDLVMVLVDGVLFVADIYSPGNPPFPPGPSDLYQTILSHGLEGSITAIVGAHGYEVHSLAQLAAAAGA